MTRHDAPRSTNLLGARAVLRVAATMVALLCMLPAACASGGGGPRPRRYFSLAPQAPDRVRAETRPRIRVAELDCADAYDQPSVMFRVSPVEVRAFRYNRWASKPGVMITEVLRRYLAASGRFDLVTEDEIPDIELSGRVDVIEQVVEGGVWQGRLELSLYLQTVRDGRVVWRWRIDGVQDADGREVSDVVAAQSRVLSQGLSEALPALAEAAVDAAVGPPAGTAE